MSRYREPWRYQAFTGTVEAFQAGHVHISAVDDDHQFALSVGSSSIEHTKARLNRILACVNALAGITDEQLALVLSGQLHIRVIQFFCPFNDSLIVNHDGTLPENQVVSSRDDRASDAMKEKL